MDNSQNNQYLRLFTKIETLKGEQVDIVNKFVDIFLDHNSEQKKNRAKHVLNLADQINDYAYKHGMSKHLADELISEIS